MTSDTVLSADGTTIVFDVEGSAFRPVLLRADGAATRRAMDPGRAEFTRRLDDRFRVVSYDRRGRGGSVPTLVMNGTASEPWLRKAVALLAELLPNATATELADQTHGVDAALLADTIGAYFSSLASAGDQP